MSRAGTAIQVSALAGQAMPHPKVLVFERMAAARDEVCASLLRENFKAMFAVEQAGVARALLQGRPDVVILGPSFADAATMIGIASQIRQLGARIPMLVIASRSTEDLAIAALRAGINDYIRYPFHADELVQAVRRCLRQNASLPQRHDSEPSTEETGGIVGNCGAMREVRERVARVASSDCNVLITGETGTGKELVAELIHKKSPRRDKPFVAINCAAIPDTLLESELFGYDKGAFTGAQSNKEGKIESAAGGTVLLDEIGDMSAYGQAKILRMIEGKEIQRLGKSGGVPLDVRILGATNQNLEQLLREDKFRKDLFFRLNVARIHLLPLRERKEDLPALIDYYVRHFNDRFGRRVLRLSEDAVQFLLQYDWPGNIRELKNLLEAIYVDLPPEDVSTAYLPAHFDSRVSGKASSNGERDRLLWALSATNWNKSKAADRLQWSRMTLYRKIAKYNLSRL